MAHQDRQCCIFRLSDTFLPITTPIFLRIVKVSGEHISILYRRAYSPEGRGESRIVKDFAKARKS